MNVDTGLFTTSEVIHHPNGGVTTITRTRSSNSQQVPQINANSNQDFLQLILGGGLPRNINNNRNIDRQEAFLNILLQHMQRSRENPVEGDILDSLPEMNITDLNKIPEDKKECVVCLCAFELNQKALILPCTHLFHTNCIKDWFKTQNTCPICKFKLDRDTLNEAMNNNI